MNGYNRVIVMGNLTRDPDVRKISTGSTVADLGLAVNETHRSQDGEQVEKTVFVDVVAWGRQAEAAGQYLKKGAAIFVEGALQFDQWQAEDGSNRSKVRVRAQRITFIGGNGNGNAQPRQNARGNGNGTGRRDSRPQSTAPAGIDF